MSRSKKYKNRIPRNKTPNRSYSAVLFLVFIIAIFGSAGYILMSGAPSLTPGDKNATKITITMAGFDPDTIRAKVGQPVTINLINPDSSHHTDGGGYHNFILEAGPSSVNITVPPESQKVFTFVPQEAGKYHWYCDICCGGIENPSMHGTLIVA